MKIIFIHQNFPGQFRHIAGHLAADRDNTVISICQEYAPGLAGVAKLVYKPSSNAGKGTHHYLVQVSNAVLNGQAVARVLIGLKQQGFVPDIIVAHAAWGEALYVKDVYPTVPLVGFFEFFYRAQGADVGFDPEFPLDMDGQLKLRTRTATHLLTLDAVDIGISPTAWQKSTFPAEYANKIIQLHEGINTTLARPDDQASVTLPNGRVLTRQDEVITYVARNLEPYRGFHQFMRAVEIICKRRPHCQVLIVGGDDISYGHALPKGVTWRSKMMAEVDIDTERVHFLGKLPYQAYLKVLQLSSAHIYLTVPFVLSWSMLEAMSVGCVVIGSQTSPVQEVIKHGENGLLVDFFDPAAIADTVDGVLADALAMQPIREAARHTILDAYSIEQGVEEYLHLINKLI